MAFSDGLVWAEMAQKTGPVSVETKKNEVGYSREIWAEKKDGLQNCFPIFRTKF
jgi:hypothetical protein